MRSRPATAPGVGTFGLGDPLGELCDVSTQARLKGESEANKNKNAISIKTSLTLKRHETCTRCVMVLSKQTLILLKFLVERSVGH